MLVTGNCRTGPTFTQVTTLHKNCLHRSRYFPMHIADHKRHNAGATHFFSNGLGEKERMLRPGSNNMYREEQKPIDDLMRHISLYTLPGNIA